MKTRREFLTGGVGAGALLVLAACGQPAAPAASSGAASTPANVTIASDPSKPETPKLATLDQELALPHPVLDGAKKEGKLSWTSSISTEPARVTMDAFKKRYPGIDIQYQEGSEETRTVRTLEEFKAGKNKLDVAMGIGGFLSDYKAA